MFPQYSFLLLAVDYEELYIPSSLVALASIPNCPKISKPVRNYFSQKDFRKFDRKDTESPRQWEQRLRRTLGDFAQCVSPPRLVKAQNNRSYVGYSGILWLAELPKNSLTTALCLALLFSELDDTAFYDADSLSRFVLPRGDFPEKRLLTKGIERVEQFLCSLQGKSTSRSGFLGATWKALIPVETLQKARLWQERSTSVPPFFGKPPAFLMAQKSCCPPPNQSFLPLVESSEAASLHLNTVPIIGGGFSFSKPWLLVSLAVACLLLFSITLPLEADQAAPKSQRFLPVLQETIPRVQLSPSAQTRPAQQEQSQDRLMWSFFPLVAPGITP